MDEFFEGFDMKEAVEQAEEAEASGDRLAQFLQACEESLVAIEKPPATVDVPEGIEGTIEAECKALGELVAKARSGDLAAVLASPLLESISKMLTAENLGASLEAGGTSQLLSELQAASTSFVDSGESTAIRRLALLLLAASSLQLYSHANWTGPTAKNFNGPFDVEADADGSTHGAIFLETLQVDGECFYELIKGPGYLWLACALLGVLPPPRDSNGEMPADAESKSMALAGGQTLAIWRGRCAFVWQLSLTEASERGMGQSPWLFKVAVDDLVGSEERPGLLACKGFLTPENITVARNITTPVLNTWRDASGKLLAPAGAPTAIESGDAKVSSQANRSSSSTATTFCSSLPAVRTALIVEFCVRLCWFGRASKFGGFLKDACAPVNFGFEITGAMGIKRQHQFYSHAQMVVKTSSTAAATNKQAIQEDIFAPKSLSLLEVDDLTDVLERPKLQEDLEEAEVSKLEKPLTAAEQLILLAKCQHIWTTNSPNDELVLTFINALAQRVLVTFEKPEDTPDGQMSTANWLSFSCGLFFRCRAEHHRSKTKERAAWQLQALVDQFNDEKPSVAHRLLLVHSAGFPARFHVRREMAVRMMKMGMASTAFEQLKELRMWPDCIDCLMVAGRKVECLDLVNDLLAKRPTPRLWCALGDIEEEKAEECYEKAWQLSKHRYARAQRGLGRIHFRAGRLDKAIDCFQTAVRINPLHSTIWFTMGVAQMKLKRWDDAALSMQRCVGVDDENSEAWANLGAVHAERGDLKQARSAFFEACRLSHENWRMWQSAMGICMRLRDIQGVINCMKRLVELNMYELVPENILGILTMSVLSDAEGMYEGRTGASFAQRLLEFFEWLTDKCTSTPCYWRFLAELQVYHKQPEKALESRLRESRAAQAKLWVEADPDVFTKGITDLIKCFDSIAESLADPRLAEQARPQLQPFAYLVRNSEKQLTAKLEACPNVPQVWADANVKISQIATDAETKVASEQLTVGAAAAEAA